jgi:hypothetical protein
VEDEFLEPTRRQSRQGAEGMTEEEMERFALVLKESERIRALIAKEEAALSDGEHDDYGIPMAAAPQEQPASVLLAPDLRISETGAARRK